MRSSLLPLSTLGALFTLPSSERERFRSRAKRVWQFLVISQYFLTDVYTDVRCEIQMTVTKERFGSASIHFSSELPRNGEASGVRALGPSSAVAGTPQTGARDIFPSGRIVTSLQHRGAKPTGSVRRPKAGFAPDAPPPSRPGCRNRGESNTSAEERCRAPRAPSRGSASRTARERSSRRWRWSRARRHRAASMVQAKLSRAPRTA